jgi:hypothetical protein
VPVTVWEAWEAVVVGVPDDPALGLLPGDGNSATVIPAITTSTSRTAAAMKPGRVHGGRSAKSGSF